MERVASDAPLQAAGAHGAQLEKSGGETALAEGRQSADGVVAQDHGGLLEVKLCGGRLQGEDAGESLAADLVLHVVRVGRVPMMTFPSLLSHHRKTMPQPCREASQVMMTMRASPVSPAEKAAWRVLGTKGQRGRPR